MYVSNLQVYSNVCVITSVVTSDHKTVIAYSDKSAPVAENKPSTPHTSSARSVPPALCWHRF